MLSLIRRLATRNGIMTLLALYLIVFVAILFTLAQLSEVSGGHGILDFDRGYTPDRVAEVLGSYGPEGMALYRRIQVLDLINPALYSLLLACLTAVLWNGRGPGWLPLIALLGGLGDYLENATLFMIARAYPEVSETLVVVSSTLSLLKNALLVVSVAAFLSGLMVWLFFRLRRTRS